ncbi:hypothetical protein BDZ88DRAFT_452279 [Geranomyces variabilis]|nr:hypothetical protein BDZ88DRAFT_452279 [Geranomyces variabilis]KAJ3133381.1 hypothetical protein HDU90_006330 [Geranomyces variabilis]
MQAAIQPNQHYQHHGYPQHVPSPDFSAAAASAAEVASDTTTDSIPRSYMIDKLRSLSSTYWGDGFTADCWLLIQGHSPDHPPVTLLPAHSPYLVACVPALRDLLAAAGGPINRALNSPDSPALPLTVRPPCPEAFPELLRWVYTADISHLRKFLKKWQGAAAAILANAAWAGIVDRELRTLCEGYMLEEEAKDDAADLEARAKEKEEGGGDDVDGGYDDGFCAGAAPLASTAMPADPDHGIYEADEEDDVADGIGEYDDDGRADNDGADDWWGILAPKTAADVRG